MPDTATSPQADTWIKCCMVYDCFEIAFGVQLSGCSEPSGTLCDHLDLCLVPLLNRLLISLDHNKNGGCLSIVPCGSPVLLIR